MTPEAAAYQLVTGGRSLSGERASSVAARMTELEQAAGSKQGAARLAGVAPRTWRDWRRGTHAPSRASAERLRGALRRVRVDPRREARLRRFGSGGVTIRIKGRFRVSEDERDRTLNLRSGNIPAWGRGIPGALVDASLRGDDAGAGGQLLGLVSAYLPEMEVTALYRVSMP